MAIQGSKDTNSEGSTATSDVSKAFGTAERDNPHAWEDLNEESVPEDLLAKFTESEGEEGDEESSPKKDAEEEEVGDDKDSEEVDETEEEESEEDEEDEEDEDEGEDSDQSKKEAKDTEVPAKSYKVTLSNGDKIDLDDNAELKIKADGSFKKVTVKDLKESYAAQATRERMIEEAAQERQKAQEDTEKLTEYTNNLKEILTGMNEGLKSNDVISALENIAYLQGEDPTKFITTWFDSFGKFFEEIAVMSPEERKVSLSQQKANIKERQLDRERKKMKTDQSKGQSEQLLSAVKQKWGVGKQEIEEALTAYQGQGYDVKSVTIENCVDLALGTRVLDNMNEASEELDVTLTNEQQQTVYLKLFDAEKNGNQKLELADYADIIKKAIGETLNKKSKDLGRKARKKNRTASPKKVKKQKTEDESPIKGGTIDDRWASLG